MIDLTFAQTVIVVFAKRGLLKRHANRFCNRFFMTYFGIDLNKFHPAVEKGRIRKKLGLGVERRIILSPRNLSNNYNIDTILKAVPKVKEQIKDVVFIFI